MSGREGSKDRRDFETSLQTDTDLALIVRQLPSLHTTDLENNTTYVVQSNTDNRDKSGGFQS